MKNLETRILEACQEVVTRNQELLPLLSKAMGVEKIEEVFYSWAFRRCKQSGQLDNVWKYRFHGLECDLKNHSDGRYLRIDFGPNGRVDTFSAWGILQFIMTSVSPWSQFDDLKSYFAKTAPPYDRFSGDSEKFHRVWDTLVNNGCFDIADTHLVELQEKYTYTNENGTRFIKFPSEISEKTKIDTHVSHKRVISQHGYKLLNSSASLVE